MKSVGVICECNPFHAGHAYLFRRAREAGADCIVAVMSGPFVQRGEAAIAEPALRAKAVLSGGADLVVELPFPYAAAPAEFFASAGVDILSKMGVSELWFGSECGNLSLLSRLSELSDSDAFQTAYAESKNTAEGTAEAYLATLSRLFGKTVTLSSNDLLGIAYLRAIRAKYSSMIPVTVRREGSAYLATSLDKGYPSATALRRLWREQGVSSVLPHLPEAVRAVYADCTEPYSLFHAERLILGYLRLTSAERLESVAVLSGGLGSRLKNAAMEATDLDGLLRRTATKKYPNARILRGILFSLTEIGEDALKAPVAYTRLLAANAVGCELLAGLRRNGDFSVVTRHAELPDTEEARRQSEYEMQAWSLYALCGPTSKVPSLWKKPPFIEKKD